jgi:hypothetical protein
VPSGGTQGCGLSSRSGRQPALVARRACRRRARGWRRRQDRPRPAPVHLGLLQRKRAVEDALVRRRRQTCARVGARECMRACARACVQCAYATAKRVLRGPTHSTPRTAHAPEKSRRRPGLGGRRRKRPVPDRPHGGPSVRPACAPPRRWAFPGPPHIHFVEPFSRPRAALSAPTYTSSLPRPFRAARHRWRGFARSERLFLRGQQPNHVEGQSPPLCMQSSR